MPKNPRYKKMQLVFLLILVTMIVSMAWNKMGPVQLLGVDNNYKVKISEGNLRGKVFTPEAALLIKDWVENRASPEIRPFQIWWHQFWYNAITSGYELKLWIEPDNGSGGRMYALYQTGNMMYLRIEYRGKNRVLRADFTAKELEDALRAYVQKP